MGRGISPQEILHSGYFPQGLRDGNGDDQQHESNWQNPQYAYPVPADPDFWHNTRLRWQPCAEHHTIIRRAELVGDAVVTHRQPRLWFVEKRMNRAPFPLVAAVSLWPL